MDGADPERRIADVKRHLAEAEAAAARWRNAWLCDNVRTSGIDCARYES